MDARAATGGRAKSIINVILAGIQICEHLPRLAQNIDKLAIVRSMHGFFNEHTDSQVSSG